MLRAEIERLEQQIIAWHRQDATSRRLATIPGIGPITASAMAASAPDPALFRSGRQFAAWLGLTPRAHSSGRKERQAGISMGDGYLRRLLVVGATAVLRMARQRGVGGAWIVSGVFAHPLSQLSGWRRPVVWFRAFDHIHVEMIKSIGNAGCMVGP